MILGTRIDIIAIARIAKAVDPWGKNSLNHVFTEEEILYAQTHHFE